MPGRRAFRVSRESEAISGPKAILAVKDRKVISGLWGRPETQALRVPQGRKGRLVRRGQEEFRALQDRPDQPVRPGRPVLTVRPDQPARPGQPVLTV